jgi:hypothetical protein
MTKFLSRKRSVLSRMSRKRDCVESDFRCALDMLGVSSMRSGGGGPFIAQGPKEPFDLNLEGFGWHLLGAHRTMNSAWFSSLSATSTVELAVASFDCPAHRTVRCCHVSTVDYTPTVGTGKRCWPPGSPDSPVNYSHNVWPIYREWHVQPADSLGIVRCTSDSPVFPGWRKFG